jgi:hypothetical protein
MDAKSRKADLKTELGEGLQAALTYLRGKAWDLPMQMRLQEALAAFYSAGMDFIPADYKGLLEETRIALEGATPQDARGDCTALHQVGVADVVLTAYLDEFGGDNPPRTLADTEAQTAPVRGVTGEDAAHMAAEMGRRPPRRPFDFEDSSANLRALTEEFREERQTFGLRSDAPPPTDEGEILRGNLAAMRQRLTEILDEDSTLRMTAGGNFQTGEEGALSSGARVARLRAGARELFAYLSTVVEPETEGRLGDFAPGMQIPEEMFRELWGAIRAVREIDPGYVSESIEEGVDVAKAAEAFRLDNLERLRILRGCFETLSKPPESKPRPLPSGAHNALVAARIALRSVRDAERGATAHTFKLPYPTYSYLRESLAAVERELKLEATGDVRTPVDLDSLGFGNVYGIMTERLDRLQGYVDAGGAFMGGEDAREALETLRATIREVCESVGFLEMQRGEADNRAESIKAELLSLKRKTELQDTGATLWGFPIVINPALGFGMGGAAARASGNVTAARAVGEARRIATNCLNTVERYALGRPSTFLAGADELAAREALTWLRAYFEAPEGARLLDRPEGAPQGEGFNLPDAVLKGMLRRVELLQDVAEGKPLPPAYDIHNIREDCATLRNYLKDADREREKFEQVLVYAWRRLSTSRYTPMDLPTLLLFILKLGRGQEWLATPPDAAEVAAAFGDAKAEAELLGYREDKPGRVDPEDGITALGVALCNDLERDFFLPPGRVNGLRSLIRELGEDYTHAQRRERNLEERLEHVLAYVWRALHAEGTDLVAPPSRRTKLALYFILRMAAGKVLLKRKPLGAEVAAASSYADASFDLSPIGLGEFELTAHPDNDGAETAPSVREMIDRELRKFYGPDRGAEGEFPRSGMPPLNTREEFESFYGTPAPDVLGGVDPLSPAFQFSKWQEIVARDATKPPVVNGDGVRPAFSYLSGCISTGDNPVEASNRLEVIRRYVKALEDNLARALMDNPATAPRWRMTHAEAVYCLLTLTAVEELNSLYGELWEGTATRDITQSLARLVKMRTVLLDLDKRAGEVTALREKLAAAEGRATEAEEKYRELNARMLRINELTERRVNGLLEVNEARERTITALRADNLILSTSNSALEESLVACLFVYNRLKSMVGAGLDWHRAILKAVGQLESGEYKTARPEYEEYGTTGYALVLVREMGTIARTFVETGEEELDLTAKAIPAFKFSYTPDLTGDK